MWLFGGGGQKSNDGASASQSPQQRGVVDMTSLDITYITHRLLGELRSRYTWVTSALNKESRSWLRDSFL